MSPFTDRYMYRTRSTARSWLIWKTTLCGQTMIRTKRQVIETSKPSLAKRSVKPRISCHTCTVTRFGSVEYIHIDTPRRTILPSLSCTPRLLIHSVTKATWLTFTPTPCLQAYHVGEKKPIDSSSRTSTCYVQAKRKQTVSSALTAISVLEVIVTRIVVTIFAHTGRLVQLACRHVFQHITNVSVTETTMRTQEVLSVRWYSKSFSYIIIFYM